MPIYEYICRDCGERYDKFVRSSLAKIELKCPKCGSTQGDKAISVFGVGSSQSSASAVSSAAACSPVG